MLSYTDCLAQVAREFASESLGNVHSLYDNPSMKFQPIELTNYPYKIVYHFVVNWHDSPDKRHIVTYGPDRGVDGVYNFDKFVCYAS